MGQHTSCCRQSNMSAQCQHPNLKRRTPLPDHKFQSPCTASSTEPKAAPHLSQASAGVRQMPGTAHACTAPLFTAHCQAATHAERPAQPPNTTALQSCSVSEPRGPCTTHTQQQRREMQAVHPVQLPHPAKHHMQCKPHTGKHTAQHHRETHSTSCRQPTPDQLTPSRPL